jgi:hypothetical protein
LNCGKRIDLPIFEDLSGRDSCFTDRNVKEIIMNYTFLAKVRVARVLLVYVLLNSLNQVAHAQSITDILSTVCSTTATTADADRKTRCDNAQNLYLDAALQNLVNQQASQSQAQSTSVTAAYLDALTKLRTSLAPNATTLNAISVDGTPTVPKMDASAQAELMQRAALQASQAAGKLSATALSCSAKDVRPVILLGASNLPTAVRAYKSSLAAMNLMSEQADLMTLEVKSVEPPKTLPSIRFEGTRNPWMLSGPELSTRSTIPGMAALGSISLLLDLASNAAALAASMRPQVSVSSATLSDATLQASHVAYIDTLIQRGFVVKDAQAVLPLADSSSKIRSATHTLDGSINKLQEASLIIAKHMYPKESVPAKGSVSATLTASPQEIRRDQVLTSVSTLLAAARLLKASIFTDTRVAGSTTLQPAMVNAFDHVEALGLMEPSSAKCFYTVQFEPQTVSYDQHVKQRFFGAPIYNLRVVGRTRVQITQADGRIAVNDNILIDSGWVGFGP